MQPNEKQMQIVSENWARVQESVCAACDEASRDSQEVTIVGVTKYVGAELALSLVQAGCSILGENRPQSLWEKSDCFGKCPDLQVSWHLIGHLQRNKIRRTLPLIDCIHSLDSLRLARALSREAEKTDLRLKSMVEVNLTQDASKTGLKSEELLELLDQAEELSGIELSGLMAMSSHHASSDQARSEFAAVRSLRDELSRRYPDLKLSELSMGMSGDFREAILEGATLVRIGSSLWEGVLT